MSVPTVTRGIRTLVEQGYIVQDLVARKLKGQGAGFGTAQYTLWNPELVMQSDPSGRMKVEIVPLTVAKVGRLLPGNHVPYVTFPRLVVADHTEEYSLAMMTDAELAVYLSCLSSATRSNTFTTELNDLTRIAGLTETTTKKALYALGTRKLMKGKLVGDTLEVNLLDPATGHPIPLPPTLPEPGPEQDDSDVPKFYAPADVERLLLACIPPGRYPVTATGNMNVTCPYHDDRRPSLSVDLNNGGRFYCHACAATGPFEDLLAKLRGVPRDQLSDLKRLKKVKHEPDESGWTRQDYDSATKYWYRTLDSTLIRAKYRNNRIKDFRWFHWAGKVQPGFGPGPATLYGQELIARAETVVVTEGEKDSDAVSMLHWEHGHPIIGVTSGSCRSWKADFANLLVGKRIVIMPDADQEGEEFADAVCASLDTIGIPYATQRFQGYGCKDVADYLLQHSYDDLLRLII